MSFDAGGRLWSLRLVARAHIVESAASFLILIVVVVIDVVLLYRFSSSSERPTEREGFSRAPAVAEREGFRRATPRGAQRP